MGMASSLAPVRDNQFKTRENLARRRATRQGLVLRRSPRRDKQALDYGLYSLVPTDYSKDLVFNLTIEEVERQLDAGAEARRAKALDELMAQAAAGGGRKRKK
jgi:hypothetical protein